MADQIRTQFALAAMDMASTFNTAFAETSFGGFRLRMTAPEGQSTSGGKLAVEHVVLEHQADGYSVVLATVAHAPRAVEIRAHEHVARMFESRFQGRAFGMPQNVFDDAVVRVKNFFEGQAFQIAQAAGPKLPKAQAPARGGSLAWLWIVLGLLALGGGGFAAWWFLVRGG
jgi:hypothetical protein